MKNIAFLPKASLGSNEIRDASLSHQKLCFLSRPVTRTLSQGRKWAEREILFVKP